MDKIDPKTIKFHKISTIVMAVLLVVALVTGLIMDQYSISEVSSKAVIFVALMLLICPPFILLFGFNWLHLSISYKRLNKKDPAETSCYSSDSVLASRIAVFIFGAAVIADALYCKTWIELVGGDCIFMTVLLLIFHSICFLIPALILYHQRSKDKYRDNIDKKDIRKVRMAIIPAIAVLLILSMIGAFAVCQAHTMTKYVYRSRQEMISSQ